MGLVGARGQVHTAREAPQAVRFATRVGGPQVPDDGPRARIEDPGGCRPRGLFVILPVLVIALPRPVGPGLGADGRDLHVLRRGQDEDADLVLAWRQIVDISEDRGGGRTLGLGQQQQQHERHG